MFEVKRLAGTTPLFSAALASCCCVGTAWASDQLPIGTVAEPSALWSALRLLLGAAGLFLLVSGHRRPRLVIGSTGLVLGLAVGALGLGSISLPLALATAWLIAAALLGMYLRWPRLTVGLSSWWTLPAVFVIWLLHTGSFDRNLPLVAALAGSSALASMVRPAIGLTLQGAVLGGSLIAVTQAVLPGATVALVASIAGIAGHLLLFLLQGSRSAAPRDQLRWPAWQQSLQWTAVLLSAALVVVSLGAPSYGPLSSRHPDRLRSLDAEGALDRPALLIGAENNAYLSGTPHPFAVVDRGPGIRSRVLLPVLGRSLDKAVREMRLNKSADELDTMRRAAAITSATFADIAPLIRPGVSEQTIDEAIRASFSARGADGLAFASIVAAGGNAVNPHYQRNDAVMREGIVVIDIGCSVNGYASDMTRSFPVDGELSEAQDRLFATTEAAYRAAVELCGPGASLEAMDTRAKEVIAAAGFDGFMTHGIGHHVGLNVHDPHRDELQPGMVVTIEPGIYIPRDAAVDASFWDLGVRLEDSFLVTEAGCEALTSFPLLPGNRGD